jgi:hypothetical protein
MKPLLLDPPKTAGTRTGLNAGGGFTLLEVMIALGVFFMALFAILSVMSQGLGAARSLQTMPPDIGGLAAQLLTTNRIDEGMVQGDFGDLYPGFTWARNTVEIATNGLYEVEFKVVGSQLGRPYEAAMSVLVWRPDSGARLPGGRFR